MRHLAYDVTRCRGDNCTKRDQCMRFLSRVVLGERTPFIPACQDGVMFIPVVHNA